MKRENNFDLTSYGNDWYTEAAGMEFDTTWGDIPFFKGDVSHLNFNRAQTCWIDSEFDDLQIRRAAVKAFARAIISPTDVPDEDLLRAWPLLGVETCSPRLASAICTLYNDAPVRTFNANEGINTGFEELYTEFKVNLAMKQAYKNALFTNLVLLWPDWVTKSIKVLTPDYFRVKGTDGVIEELWIPVAGKPWKDKTFICWTATERIECDHKGNPTKTESHKYGRIPGVFLKLNPSNDLYGAGITEAAEINALQNLIRYLSTRVGAFQSFSVGVLKNMKLKPGTRIGPGHVLEGSNMGGDPSQSPSFEYVTPDGKFIDLESYKEKIVRSFVRTHGLPAFLVDEGAGQPPTGAALQVMERELNDKRKEHAYALIEAERSMAELIAALATAHSVVRRSIAIDSTFSVKYAEPDTFTEPSAEFEHDMKRAQNGTFAPSALVQKYFGIVETDDEAATRLAQNKKYFSTTNELRSTVGGAQALSALVKDYEAGLLSREAGIQQAVQVYGFTRIQAEAMFVANHGTPPSPQVSQTRTPVL